MHYDWKQIHAAYEASGLSKMEFYRFGLLEHVSKRPPIGVFLRELKAVELPPATNIVDVVELPAAPRTAKQRRSAAAPSRVSIVLPNGTRISFSTTQPERFAAAILSIGERE